MYYADKIATLQDLFGVHDLALEADVLRVGERRYPIVEDVILLCEPSEYTDYVRAKLQEPRRVSELKPADVATDIQYTFGAEWREYNKVLPEHQKQFCDYFDLVDLASLRQSRVCDLGCGNGRWSYFLENRCRELVLVDFSDAIFVAHQNLSSSNKCLFFMCDIKKMPFRDDFCDFLFCIGVLHHLPTRCLEEVRLLKRCARTLLVFVYYALDNRPAYFRLLLRAVTVLRLWLCKIENRKARRVMAKLLMFLLYVPLIGLGALLKPFGLSSHVPLYDSYHDSLARLEQDVYDRFFTRIEQRVTRKEIQELRDTFSRVEFPGNYPYYHFLCER